jgi:hypothetical protein
VEIVRDETSSAPARRTIIGWQQRTWFGGEGATLDSTDTVTWKNDQIKSALSDFQAANPGAPASAYFNSLGMVCKASSGPLPDNVRCEIELPIVVRCGILLGVPGGPPIPKQLEGQVPASLWTSVALLPSGGLKVSTRILPVPEGRLCHR